MASSSQRVARIVVGCMGLPMLYLAVSGLARGRMLFPSRYHPAYVLFAHDPRQFLLAFAFWMAWGVLLLAIGFGRLSRA